MVEEVRRGSQLLHRPAQESEAATGEGCAGRRGGLSGWSQQKESLPSYGRPAAVRSSGFEFW